MKSLGYGHGVSILDGAPGVGSGRMPLGSGKVPYQRYTDYWSSYKRLEAQHYTPSEIAEKLGVFNRYGKPDAQKAKNLMSIATAEKRALNISSAVKLYNQGLNKSEIARRLGTNESTIRKWLEEDQLAKTTRIQQNAELLKSIVDENKYVDIGPGVASILGITDSSLSTAVTYLETLGYSKHFIRVDNTGGYKTEISVLVPPGVTYSELSDHRFDIVYPTQESRAIDPDGNVISIGLKYHPTAIDPSRVYIRYPEEGGSAKDGLIEIRPGCEDLDLGNSIYAQVRINVGDTHYLKGMCRYDDNIPEGYDIVFNTSKDSSKGFYGVVKELKTIGDSSDIDWSNPFGTAVTQKEYIDSNGEQKVNALNIVREMGEWETKWKNSIASQMWAKQAPSLAKRQLDLDSEKRHAEYEEICNLTNPTVKRYLLDAFQSKCDSAAEELKAAPFPGQRWRVLMPGPDLKDDEVYAPTYPDGTKVALVRYPHEGTFAIPILTVRNTGSPEEKNLKGAPDAIAINATNLKRLSGADTDGDAVCVIPLSDQVRIRSTKPLKALEDFDPHTEYAGYEGMPILSDQRKNLEMGKTTNLIMDMHIKSADPETEIGPVARHSMVVIDCIKHKLNFAASEKDHHIEDLKKQWQDTGDGHTGASTIITKAKSPQEVPLRKDWVLSKSSVDENGDKIYSYPSDESKSTYTKGKLKAVLNDGTSVSLKTEGETGQQYYLTDDLTTGKKKKVYVTDSDLSRKQEEVFVNTDKEGKQYYTKTDEATGKKVRQYITEDDFVSTPKTVGRTTKSTKMAEAKDAYELTTGGSKDNVVYPIEAVAADYANDMKDLARSARKEWVNTGLLSYDKTAAQTYKAEVDSLNSKLTVVQQHSPVERQALLHANRIVSIVKSENPYLTKEEESKLRGQKLQEARHYFGEKTSIEITPNEWEAIQAGAISDSKLMKILENTDIDTVRQYATPRVTKSTTSTQQALILNMARSHYSPAEIASVTGASSSTVYNVLKEAGFNFND